MEIPQHKKNSVVSMANEWHQFANENHFWFEWRFKSLLKLNVLPNVFQKIFEIGCGTGVFLKQLESKYNYLLMGCELEYSTYEMGIKDDNKNNILYYDIFDDNPDMLASYDIVFLMDVIEHIDDDIKFIEKATQYLKPKGTIIINVPAHNLLFSKYDIAAGHYRRYNKKDLEAKLVALNLSVLHIKYWGVALYPIALMRKIFLNFINPNKIIEKGFKPQNRVIENILRFLMYIDTRIKEQPFGTSIIAVAKK